MLRPSLAGEALKFLAFGWAVVTAAARLGYTESDGLVVIATAFGLRAAEMLLKKGRTVLATFPLALTFKYVSPFLPRFSIPESKFFDCDGATPAVAKQRKDALVALQAAWKKKYPKCLQFGQDLKQLISDVRFTSGRCFPPFNAVVNDYLDPSVALEKTNGPTIIDIDDTAALDISGSYGVNVCGYEAYKKFIDAGWAKARAKGRFLGARDPITLENIKMLKVVSGLDEISFHMSGTEAVMAAVRVARFNQKKPLVVTFGGAYHGWWDGMQPYVGNDRTPKDVLCLKDMNARSLAVIRARSSEIAAVRVNPLQCFHLNSSPPSDPVLSTNNRKVGPTPGYKEWLHKLRAPCTAAASARRRQLRVFADGDDCAAGSGSDGDFGHAARPGRVWLARAHRRTHALLDLRHARRVQQKGTPTTSTLTPTGLPTVRAGYALQPAACCTHRRRRVACLGGPRTVCTSSPYRPLACFHTRRTVVADLPLPLPLTLTLTRRTGGRLDEP